MKNQDTRSIDEVMLNIDRMSRCILASYGYTNWQEVPPLIEKQEVTL